MSSSKQHTKKKMLLYFVNWKKQKPLNNVINFLIKKVPTIDFFNYEYNKYVCLTTSLSYWITHLFLNSNPFKWFNTHNLNLNLKNKGQIITPIVCLTLLTIYLPQSEKPTISHWKQMFHAFFSLLFNLIFKINKLLLISL